MQEHSGITGISEKIAYYLQGPIHIDRHLGFLADIMQVGEFSIFQPQMIIYL
jgi:hypothetical protein